MAINAHRVFKNSGTDGYLAALTIEDDAKAELRSARDKIRDALKTGLRDWTSTVQKQELFENVLARDAEPILRPKFRMQGSFAYHTINDPAQNPPQEIDLDDGVFLPTSFLNQDGALHPIIVSQGYFLAVERMLAPLCKGEGWTLVTDKSSCVRVKLSEQAHVDLALYAIPDAEFVTLVEKVVAMSANAMDAAIRKSELQDGIELSDKIYASLDPDHIMLAHREEGWKKSDPRKLEDWFNEALEKHGDQLRRVCRYLKGWRDYQWDESRLSSIALMASAVTAYDEAIGQFDDSRDDKALMKIASRLPSLLAARIDNPVVEGARLDEGWTMQQRSEYMAQAAKLHDSIRSALELTDDANVALNQLTGTFGDRIPYETKYISVENALETKAVSFPNVLRHGLLQEGAQQSSVREAVQKEGDNRFG